MAVKTKSAIKFYEMARVDRPLTIIEGRLYRSDEKYMLCSKTTSDEFALYDLDGVIPYGVQDPPSPDETMAMADIMRGNKNIVHKSSIFAGLRKHLVIIILLAVVGYWLITKYVM